MAFKQSGLASYGSTSLAYFKYLKAYFPSPNHLWAHIKDEIHDAMVTFIPCKLSK